MGGRYFILPPRYLRRFVVVLDISLKLPCKARFSIHERIVFPLQKGAQLAHQDIISLGTFVHVIREEGSCIP